MIAYYDDMVDRLWLPLDLNDFKNEVIREASVWEPVLNYIFSGAEAI